MSENSGFFNAQLVDDEPDLNYEASDFAGYFSNFIGNGVFANPANNLQIVPESSMTVKLKAGKAFINGYWYVLSEDVTISVPTAPSSGTRYDAVVLELNIPTRTIAYKYLSSVAQDYPSSNSFLTRSDTVYQICLAILTVPSGTTKILALHISDTRPLDSYCGWVEGVVKQIETEGLFMQYNSAFEIWFESVKDLLDEADVYHIESQISTILQLLSDGITTLKELNQGEGFRIWMGTTAEYEALTEYLEGVLYIRTDDPSVAEIRAVTDHVKFVDVPDDYDLNDVYTAYPTGITMYRVSGNIGDTYPVLVPAVSYNREGKEVGEAAIVTMYKSHETAMFVFEYNREVYVTSRYLTQGGVLAPVPWAKVSQGVDTGWMTLSISGTGFSAGSPAPKYRRIGNRVMLKGAVIVNTDIVSDISTVFATLGLGFKPASSVYRLVAGEGDRMARLYVATNGNININYFKTYSGETVTGSHWVQLDCEFLTD